MLHAARTVIVDEIHAVAGNKRGSHLTLTLERLAHVAGQPVQRIGLSATQRPIEAVARLLVGAGDDRSEPDGSPRCSIVDAGHRRELDLGLDLPGDELGAVASAEQMAEILDLIAGHVTGHRTTLVFVNTRRMAERVAHELGERLGDGQVAAHHGSLSRDRRQRVEARLRGGDLRALVATASLELGIDIGPVELVCQIGSPRSFATFLQRVGRSNHTTSGFPPDGCTPRPGTSWSSAPRCSAAPARDGWTRSSSRPARSTSWPSRWSRSARPLTGSRTTCSPWSAARRRSRRCRRRTSRTSPSWSARESAPAAAVAPPTCTGTRSTAGCGAGAAPGSRRSPPAARFPSSATSGCWPSRTTPWSARSTRTGRSRAWPGMCSCSEPPRGGSGGSSRASSGSRTRTARRRRCRSGSARHPAVRSSCPRKSARSGPRSPPSWRRAGRSRPPAG